MALSNLDELSARVKKLEDHVQEYKALSNQVREMDKNFELLRTDVTKNQKDMMQHLAEQDVQAGTSAELTRTTLDKVIEISKPLDNLLTIWHGGTPENKIGAYATLLNIQTSLEETQKTKTAIYVAVVSGSIVAAVAGFGGIIWFLLSTVFRVPTH